MNSKATLHTSLGDFLANFVRRIDDGSPWHHKARAGKPKTSSKRYKMWSQGYQIYEK